MRAHAVACIAYLLPSNVEVHRQTIHFLQQGDFDGLPGGSQ